MILIRRLEKALLTVGLILMAVFAVAQVDGWISSSVALQRFEESNNRKDAGNAASSVVDFSLWSAQRIREYKDSLAHDSGVPVAVLRIPKVRLEVPVFDGTDDLTLNRGAGRIIGTARPGESGNTGIAGHRDGFFRGLKDIGVGDKLDLKLAGISEHYVVTSIQITTPEDVSVLQPTATPALTLVTCYPFYFVGSAPQRYIVRAERIGVDASDSAVVSAQIP